MWLDRKVGKESVERDADGDDTVAESCDDRHLDKNGLIPRQSSLVAHLLLPIPH